MPTPPSWRDLGAELLVGGLAVGQQGRQHRGTDHLAQRGLRDPVDRLAIVGDLQRRRLGVGDMQKMMASTLTGTVSL